MNFENQKILLTIKIGGRLGAMVSNKSTKKIVHKVKTSPFETSIKNSKGVPTGKYNTPKGHFKAPNNFQEREITECTRKVLLNEDCVNYFISNDSCPYFINKKKWEKMSKQDRLEVNLTINAENNEFSYEVI